MRRHLVVYLTVFVFTAVCGCVSLERDIYFRTKDPTLSIIADRKALYPQQYFGQAFKIEGQIDRKVYLTVLNKASGSYSWGVLLPIIPVFFFPDFHFKLDKAEKLKLLCSVDYDIKLRQEKNGFSYETKESIDLREEGKKIGSDICLDARIVVENQTQMRPVSIERTSNSTVFTYDIFAAEVGAFTIDQLSIKLRTGEIAKVDNKFEVTKRDWTRLYFPELNN